MTLTKFDIGQQNTVTIEFFIKNGEPISVCAYTPWKDMLYGSNTKNKNLTRDLNQLKDWYKTEIKETVVE